MNTVMDYRKELLRRILARHNLPAVLFCGGMRENWDSWLTDNTALPIVPPFGRLNLFIATAKGDVHCLCAETSHPCDFPHYPLFEPRDFPDLFADGKIGIVNPECLLKLTRDAIEDAFPGLEYENLTEEFLRAKALRHPEELARAERAARVYDRAFSLLPSVLREGQTELQAAVELRSALGTLGAETVELCEDPHATTIVTITSAPDGAPGAAEPIPYPGRRLRLGDRVNVTVNGYLAGGFSAALGRCYVLGEAKPETRDMWALAVRTQDMLADALRPGVTIENAVSAVSRELPELTGMGSPGENCVYGIGLSRSEAPRNVDSTRSMPLEEGMTLVIAPKLVLPGKDA
jgi:Xaa-Pro aminopeptidase